MEICEASRVPDTEDPGKYYCQQYCREGAKTEALGFVKDKSKTKLKGWKRSFLSNVGIEVFIKVIANAVQNTQ